MILTSRVFDQRTLALMQEHDAVATRYRHLFALLDWSLVPERPTYARKVNQHEHPEAAYVKALLVKMSEELEYITHLRRFLIEHPFLVLELGFVPCLDVSQPYGFDVEQTVPCDRWLREKQRSLDQHLLQSLLASTVHALQAEIPGLGETVAVDVKHISAWVRENNLKAYVKERYNKERQPTGDPDCRLGVKRSSNQMQADGSTKERKECLWGYGSGVVTAILHGYGDVILAEWTQTFNENDITYYHPLYRRTVATLGFRPKNVTADAAFDAWDVYQTCAEHGGMAAIALNAHGHARASSRS